MPKGAKTPATMRPAALPEAACTGSDAMLLADAAEVVQLKDKAERLAKQDDPKADDDAVFPLLDQADEIEARVISSQADTLAGVLAKVRVLKAWVDDHETVKTVTQVAGILRDLEAMTAREPATTAAPDAVTPALATLSAAALAACEVLAPLDRLDQEGVEKRRAAALDAWEGAMAAVRDHPSAGRADVMAKLDLSAWCLALLGYKRGRRPAGSGSGDELPWSCEMLEHAALGELAELMQQPADRTKGEVAQAAGHHPVTDHALALATRFRHAYAAYWAEERGAADAGTLPPDVLDELDTARNLLIWATPATPEGFLAVAAALQMGAMPPRYPAGGEQDQQYAWAIARMARDLTGAEA
jgi:hypothetical protein